MTTWDTFLTALCLWREARGESFESRRAIWWVIRNRVADKRWPDTMTEVILQPRQFSSFNSNDPNIVRYPLPGDKQATECLEICESPGVDDPTLGANHYHSLPDAAKWPAWADKSKETTRIGALRFYKL